MYIYILAELFLGAKLVVIVGYHSELIQTFQALLCVTCSIFRQEILQQLIVVLNPLFILLTDYIKRVIKKQIKSRIIEIIFLIDNLLLSKTGELLFVDSYYPWHHSAAKVVELSLRSSRAKCNQSLQLFCSQRCLVATQSSTTPLAYSLADRTLQVLWFVCSHFTNLVIGGINHPVGITTHQHLGQCIEFGSHKIAMTQITLLLQVPLAIRQQLIIV